jgi:2,3-bisphosphoglycerate-dependent phosphoglycerate mutase
MQFYFIRHAQSENNVLWDRTGADKGRKEDPQLTSLGRRQAKALAQFLHYGNPVGGYETDHRRPAGFELTHLYTSLMKRAVATAAEISQVLGLAPIAWAELHENGGIYLQDPQTSALNGLPGGTRRFFEQKYPNLLLPDWLDERGWWQSQPYELEEIRWQRANRVLETLIARHGDTQDHVAVVSHGGFYNTLLKCLMDMPRQEGLWFTMHNAAITRIDFVDGSVDIVYQNRVDYLPVEIVS